MNNNQTEGSNRASWGRDRTRDTRDNRDSRDRDNRSYRDRDYREKDRDYRDRDRDRDRDRGRDYRDRERDRNNRDRGRDGGRVDGGGEGEKFWADPTDLSSFVLRGPNGEAVPLANGAGMSSLRPLLFSSPPPSLLPPPSFLATLSPLSHPCLAPLSPPPPPPPSITSPSLNFPYFFLFLI